MSRELEDKAARYVLRREERAWTEADQQELDRWLDESTLHQAAFWRMEHGWAAADRLAALNVESIARRSRFAHLARAWAKVGFAMAAATLPIVLSYFMLFQNKPEAETMSFVTGVGERKLVALPDGSRIDLNTDSKVRIVLDDARRFVYIDQGEVLFSVSPNKQKPFFVLAGDRLIKVVGTKFAVSKVSARIEILVTEGKVRFGRIVDGKVRETLSLSRGDMAISKGAQTVAFYNNPDRIDDQLGWTRGLLVFDRMTLGQAAAEFNRYNTRKLEITDPRTASIVIGGVFRLDNVEGFARLMGSAYGLKIEDAGDKIRVLEK